MAEDHEHAWEVLSLGSLSRVEYCACGEKREVDLTEEDLEQLGMSAPGVVADTLSNASANAAGGRETVLKEAVDDRAP